MEMKVVRDSWSRIFMTSGFLPLIFALAMYETDSDGVA